MLNDGNPIIGDLYFVDSQAAIQVRDEVMAEWKKLEQQNKACIGKEGRQRTQGLLREFSRRITGVLNKCEATLGVFARRQEREVKVRERVAEDLKSRGLEVAADLQGDTNEVESLFREITMISSVILEIGGLQEVVNKIVEGVIEETDDK